MKHVSRYCDVTFCGLLGVAIAVAFRRRFEWLGDQAQRCMQLVCLFAIDSTTDSVQSTSDDRDRP